MKKILFLQLPKIPLSYDDVIENVPFAAGCIAAHIDFAKVVIPDHQVINKMGDAALVRYILKHRPDMLALTLYLWNSERSLYIASKIKEHMPRCRIIVGGPEVSPDNAWLMKNKCIDHFVVGEGEGSISEKMRRIVIGKESAFITSPYIAGTLKMSPHEPVYIEAQRGCAYRCAFCNYSKGSKKVRYMDVDIVREVLVMARKTGARDIVFVDPTFNDHPEFSRLLDMLIEVNRDRYFEFNAEIKPHTLNDEDIARINKAGFATLEVGLQTTNVATQKKISCHIPLRKFSRNVNSLAKKIVIRLDLIAGLPGEDDNDIVRSIRYVKKHHPRAELFLYHLSVLPGTKMREQSEFYQDKPPYFVLGDHGRTADKFRKLAHVSLDALPSLGEIYHHRKKYNLISVRGKKSLGNVSTMNIIEITHNGLGALKKVTEDNPFCRFVVFVKGSIDVDDVLASLKLQFDQYLNRSRVYFESDIANIQIGYLDTTAGKGSRRRCSLSRRL